MPLVPVVELAVGDCLHPHIQAVRRADPGLPVRLRGDPGDLGTAALAEFLAPAVIISADSVFTRFGLANSVVANRSICVRPKAPVRAADSGRIE